MPLYVEIRILKFRGGWGDISVGKMFMRVWGPKFGSPVVAQKMCVLVVNSTFNPSPGCSGSTSLASCSIQLVSSIFQWENSAQKWTWKAQRTALTSGLYAFESSDWETLGLRWDSLVTFRAKLSSLTFAYYGSWHSRKASFVDNWVGNLSQIRKMGRKSQLL